MLLRCGSRKPQFLTVPPGVDQARNHVLQRTLVAVWPKVLGYSSSKSSADKVIRSQCGAASDHQVVADAHQCPPIEISQSATSPSCLRQLCANTICFCHRLTAVERPIFMHFKKRGTSDSEKGFEHERYGRALSLPNANTLNSCAHASVVAR